MKRITFFLSFCVLFFLQQQGFGQGVTQHKEPAGVPRGISWHDWEKMDKHWQPYSTQLYITKKDGTATEGQLIWMNDSLVMVRKSFSLPGGIMNPNEITNIRIPDIASMKVRLGGHPYQGMIIGIVAGVIPGFVTGAILAQGWTIIPAIVLGAITAAGGGTIGSFMQKANRKQVYEISAEKLNGPQLSRLRESAIFPDRLPELQNRMGEPSLHDFELLVKQSPMMQRAFPVNKWALSIHTSLMTNSVRKRLQNWYMSPLFGPSDPYYETRIGLDAGLSRSIGRNFEAGVMFQMFPGDISSSYFNKYLPDYDLGYSYNHHFRQTTLGIYGGWKFHPADRYWADRLETSIQVGPVLSDIYEHFYFSWNSISDYNKNGETFIQEHNLKPGAMLRLQASWYLIPGFSVDAGLEGFLINRITFNERTVLPESAYGSIYIPSHRLNFSNLQGYLGLSAHF